MSFVNSDEVFVNRFEDLRELGRDVLEATQNTVCILYAAKGVGKTALIQRVMNTYAQKHRCVSVNPGLISPDVQGGYIQAVFHALFKQSTSREVDQYYMKCKRDELKSYAQFLLGDIKGHTFWGTISKVLLWVLPLWVSLFGIDIFTVDSFLYQYRLPILISGSAVLVLCNLAICISKSTRIRLHRMSPKKRQKILENELCTAVGNSALPLQLSYIQSKLREGGYLFHLINIQKMDNQSQRALAHWIQLGTNEKVPNYFFLEYQTDDDSQTAILESFLRNSAPNTGKDYVNVEKYRLTSLSDQHILELAGKLVMLEQESEDEVCLYWKDKAKGDLFEIIRFIRRFDRDAEVMPISERFNSLTKQQRFVLLICLFAQPAASEADVVQMTKDFCPNASADLKVLEIEDFINITDGFLELHETELANNWENLYQEEQTVINAAKSTYDRYYWVQLKQVKCDSVDYYRIVENLLHFYSKYYTQRFDNILAYIAQNANISYNREYIERCFSELWVEYQQNKSVTIKNTWSLVSYCYNLEIYQLALKFLSLLADDDSERKIAYTALLLNRTDQYEKAVSFCKSYCTRQISPRLELILKQVELISWRMLYRTDECWTIYKELENTSKYKKYPEYGLFLRNAEIIADVKTSIKPLRQSIRFFRRCRDHKNAGISALSLGMQQARMGYFNSAIRTLKKSQRLLGRYNLLISHYYQTDLAAVFLLQGRKTDLILELLEKAELTAQTDFDQLVILVDKLAYCILTRDVNTFQRLMCILEGAQPPNITQVLRSVYFNASVMYEYCGQKNKSVDYRNRAKACHQCVASEHSSLPLNALWDARFKNDASKLPDDLAVLFHRPYHVSFISFWHFDVPDLWLHWSIMTRSYPDKYIQHNDMRLLWMLLATNCNLEITL